MTDSPLLILGLGNPGVKYQRTRHNIGVLLIDELLQRNHLSLTVHRRSNTEIAQHNGIILARTRSFMNLSGPPVKNLADFFKVPAANIIVAHDELELDFGEVKLRQGCGDHGHNGLKSITQALKTKDYWRLSLGIGRPPGRMDPAAFVLQPFSKQEQASVPIMVADAADIFTDHLRI